MPDMLVLALPQARWHAVCRCGQGKMSREDGYQYSGQWLDDLPHGQGMRTSAGQAFAATQLLQAAPNGGSNTAGRVIACICTM